MEHGSFLLSRRGSSGMRALPSGVLNSGGAYHRCCGLHNISPTSASSSDDVNIVLVTRDWYVCMTMLSFSAVRGAAPSRTTSYYCGLEVDAKCYVSFCSLFESCLRSCDSCDVPARYSSKRYAHKIPGTIHKRYKIKIPPRYHTKHTRSSRWYVRY